MHFFLHANLCDVDYQTNIGSLNSLQILLGSAFQGLHVISGEKATLRQLRSLECLSTPSKAVLDQLINWHPQRQAAYNNLDFKITVESGISGVLKETPRRWRAGLQAVGRIEILGKPTLLAEHLTDSSLYRHAADHYRRLQGLTIFDIQTRLDGGGGTSTSGRFVNTINSSDALCVCVTDSDKLSPSGPVCPTTKTCQDAANDNAWPAWHISTETRELENLIPHPFLDDALKGDAKARWLELKDVASHLPPEVLHFTDLKEGVTVKWVVSNSVDSPDRIYWNAVLQNFELADQPKACFIKGDCLIKPHPDTPLCPGCMVLPNVSRRASESVLEWLHSKPSNPELKEMDKATMKEWLRIGREIFGYCCAASKIRA